MIALLFLTAPMTVMADEASRVLASKMAADVAQSLNYKVPENWKFIAVSEQEWIRVTRQFHSLSETAFSLTQAHVTYLRESYVLTARPKRLRETLAHEFGHVICSCNDERAANYEAQRLLRIH